MSVGSSTAVEAEAPATPQSHFPKQAIVVIHGIGEQRPMDTITDFVRAVWETDPDVCRNGKPLPAETWSKPDVRTGRLNSGASQHAKARQPRLPARRAFGLL